MGRNRIAGLRDRTESAGATEAGNVDSSIYTDLRPAALGPDDQASPRVSPLSEGRCRICESGEGTAVSGGFPLLVGSVQTSVYSASSHRPFSPLPLPAYALRCISDAPSSYGSL